ncbi:MAG: DUF447 family protein [Candidatus Bathyarchaeota archaeon]|nr:DUF447 family protein [Candidatus Bathyarchaeota archaeon]
MVNLTDLGFSKNEIAETIVSTYNLDGKPNAAPMGTTMENEEQLIIKIFNSSSTYRNLLRTRCAVINLTWDIDVFYRAAFKEANPKATLPSEWFSKAQTVNAPKLNTADATIEVSVQNLVPIGVQRTKAVCNVKQIAAPIAYPKVYCRAFSAAVEAIVHATRIKAWTHNPEKQESVLKLLELIDNCKDVIERTAPDSRYSTIMKDLTAKIQSWEKLH